MSQAVITKVFSEWKAKQAINNQPVTLDEFIFAYIPGLDTDKPIDNTETIPAADKIVDRLPVSKTGVVNENSVVYSVTLGRMWAILISTGSDWQIKPPVHLR